MHAGDYKSSIGQLENKFNQQQYGGQLNQSSRWMGKCTSSDSQGSTKSGAEYKHNLLSNKGMEHNAIEKRMPH